MAVSSDGVVTATASAPTASIKFTINWTVAGSPIAATAATTVSTTTVYGATSAAILATAGTPGSAAWSVRSLTNDYAPGGARTGIDHEAPFGTLFYKAQAFDTTGALLATSTSATLSLTSATTYATWLKSLTTPSLSQAIDTAEAPEWTLPISQAQIAVIGRRDLVTVQDVRQYEQSTLTAFTSTSAGEDALTALLITPGPYLLQMPGYGEPDRYVTVGTATCKGVGTSVDPMRTWQLPLTRTVRPAPTGWSVAVPGETYADTAAALATYAARTGTYASRSQ